MIVGSNKAGTGVPWCINCTGFHPNELMTKDELALRLIHPQKAIFKKAASIATNTHQYQNKACCLCGKVYDSTGEWLDTDAAWTRTALLVRAELDAAGITGVDDSVVRLIVAKCLRAVKILFEKAIPQFQQILRSGKKIHPDDLLLFETLSFSGRLALIITSMQDGRALKIAGKSGGLHL